MNENKDNKHEFALAKRKAKRDKEKSCALCTKVKPTQASDPESDFMLQVRKPAPKWDAVSKVKGALLYNRSLLNDTKLQKESSCDEVHNIPPPLHDAVVEYWVWALRWAAAESSRVSVET